MNRADLKNILEQNNVPKYVYNFDSQGQKDERFTLVCEDGLWRVYYVERGVKTTDESFESEDAACEYLRSVILD